MINFLCITITSLLTWFIVYHETHHYFLAFVSMLFMLHHHFTEMRLNILRDRIDAINNRRISGPGPINS